VQVNSSYLEFRANYVLELVAYTADRTDSNTQACNCVCTVQFVGTQQHSRSAQQYIVSC